MGMTKILRGCGLAGALFAGAGPAHAADLAITVQGLEPRGNLVLAVFAGEADWRARKNPVREATVPVQSPAARATFKDLPPGRYGVMAYHDRNGDGRLNTLPVGLPTEPYGFSNGARGRFGPPRWREAAFEVGAGGAAHPLALR
jgi:uncharacterized protein (DUF2141 family)